MSRVFLILTIIAFLVNSCFIADEIFIPPPPEKEKTLQEKSEISAKSYIANSNHGFDYNSYGFSQIVIHKPIEILQLEDLEKQKKGHPDSLQLDTLIQSKKRYIHKHNIQRTLEIDHFYTLADPKGQITAYEDQLTMDDTLGIIASKPLIVLDIPNDYEDVLVYYFYEYTIFLASSYESSKKMSKTFYQFFKNRLEQIEIPTLKSAFLWHSLKLCKKVKDTGEFNQQAILEDMVSKYIMDERKDIINYQALEFSSLYEKTYELDETMSSYYFFHKFIGQFDENIDTNVVMVEFSPYYEIGQIYQMDRPFEPYFK